VKKTLKQKQKLEDSWSNPVAFARINDRGDLFDLRLSK